MILILNCGSSKTPYIEEIIDEFDDFRTVPILEFLLSDLDNVSGVIISGAPILVTEQPIQVFLDQLTWVKTTKTPVLGICFGHQVFGRALGFETYKLRYGHRGINQPVMDKTTNKVEITAHNHGFAVQAPVEGTFDTVYGKGEVTHICLNDGVVEGLALLDRPAFSVQYHPEAAAGPHDAGYLFDRFVDLMKGGVNASAK